MKNLFKVSALSISLGLVGLVGTNVQAAENTTTQSNDFDEVAYDNQVNLHNQYDVLRTYQIQEREQQKAQQNEQTPEATTATTAKKDFDEVAYDNKVNLHNQYDVLRTFQIQQHQKELQNQ